MGESAAYNEAFRAGYAEAQAVRNGWTAEANPWPIPEPLPDGIPNVEPFEPALLPEVFQPWVMDIAERMQCPPDFPAVAAMIALAGIAGRRVAIRPKARDSWLVIPNLWGAAIGRPGIMKTPALQEPVKPLQRLEIDAKQVFEKALRDYELAQQVNKERKAVAGSAIRKAIKAGKNPNDAASQYAEQDQPEPVRQRFIANDATVEKLGELLNQNPNGLLLFRDELSGFLRGMEKDGQESARAFYLEAWDGTGRFTYDRIGRGTLDIEHACISILGGIQPGPLAEYLRWAPDDGLIQRFQLAVWPDVNSDWRNVDKWPDTAARNNAYEVFTRLVGLNTRDIGAQFEDGEDIPYLRFSPEAQELFTEWRTGLELRLRRNELPAALESHLAKYRKLVPALALLIHLADNPDGGPLPLTVVEQACAWAEYLESHAQRLYSPATNPAYSGAHSLAKRIQTGELGKRFTLRDVYRNCWSGLSNAEDARQAVAVLVEFDWLRPDSENTGGRPRTWYEVNPRLKDFAQ